MWSERLVWLLFELNVKSGLVAWCSIDLWIIQISIACIKILLGGASPRNGATFWAEAARPAKMRVLPLPSYGQHYHKVHNMNNITYSMGREARCFLFDFSFFKMVFLVTLVKIPTNLWKDQLPKTDGHLHWQNPLPAHGVEAKLTKKDFENSIQTLIGCFEFGWTCCSSVKAHLVCEAVKISELVRFSQNHADDLWQTNLAMVTIRMVTIWYSWSPNSTYLHLDFYLLSIYKYKRHSRAIC